MMMMIHEPFCLFPCRCSDSAGWSDQIQFKTPPAGGSDELKFLAFGDMGKAPKDASVEHYIQVIVHYFVKHRPLPMQVNLIIN